jgi:hypothetical protein
MADKDSRYNMVVTIGYEIKKSEGDDFAKLKSELTYTGMDYLQITVTQKMIAELANNFADMGFVSASAMGFDAEIAAITEAKTKKEK